MFKADSVLEVGPGIWRVSNRLFVSNTYICRTGDGRECALIDPGTDPEHIDEAVQGLGLKPTRVLCTHGHFDHAGGAHYFQKQYGASCHLHEADLRTLKGSNFLMMAFKIPFKVEMPTIQAFDGLAAEGWTIHPAPGHTPGSCVLEWDNHAFTGDTLYSFGLGLSKLPGENLEKLRESLLNLWNKLPARTVVCPGHGDTAVYEDIKKNNRPLLDFLGL